MVKVGGPRHRLARTALKMLRIHILSRENCNKVELRTILVKEKARLNLLQEFEDKIYEPKEKDKTTGEAKPALLKKGKETFQMVERYFKHHSQLFHNANYDETGRTFEFDNLIKVMLTGLPSTDWIPPLLCYFEKFKYANILQFLIKLDNKFSGDWVAQYTPTDRIENMNRLIRLIETAETPQQVFTDKILDIDIKYFIRNVEASVYGRRFTRYLLIKLDYFYHDHAQRMAFESLSVEHILPQKPDEGSQWRTDFTDEQRAKWTNRLGNLVLITTSKNSSQGNSDYSIKKLRYFAKRISTCANSLRVLQNQLWTPIELEANHTQVMNKIRDHYGIRTADTA